MWHAIKRTEEPSQVLFTAPPFCKCEPLQASHPRLKRPLECKCGESEITNEWHWEPVTDDPVWSGYSTFSDCKRQVNFHSVYSSGTAVVRGNVAFLPDNHYYWEIKILTELYGTDVMIGIGSDNTNFSYSFQHFCSFLGRDSETYGYSYTGKILHDGQIRPYGYRFSQGVVVGAYLDMWLGTLEFFINRKPIGIAFRDLKKHKILYPMVCSTASLSSVKLIYSVSFPTTLFYKCLRALNISDIKKLKKIPGLQKIHQIGFWVLELASNKKLDDADDGEKNYFNNSPKRSRLSMFPKSSKSKCENFCLKTRINQFLMETPKNEEVKLNFGKSEQLNESTECPNIEILEKIHSSQFENDNSSQSNDNMWLAALEPTTYKTSSIEPKEGVIKFSTRLAVGFCESCNAKLAITIMDKNPQLNKCLDCFYNS